MKIIFDSRSEKDNFKFLLAQQLEPRPLCKTQLCLEADYTKEFLNMIVNALEGNSLLAEAEKS